LLAHRPQQFEALSRLIVISSQLVLHATQSGPMIAICRDVVLGQLGFFLSGLWL
jgi:hypothetical protein